MPRGKRKNTLTQRWAVINDELRRVAWTDAVSEAFARIKVALHKKGELVEDFDIAIATHAVAWELCLVSHNTRHMGRVRDLKLEDGTETETMTTPMLQMRTLFNLDARGRTLSNREPGNPQGPLFFIARSSTACAGAVRADLPEGLARTLEALLFQEPPCSDLRAEPELAAECRSVLAPFGRDHFSGWVPGEISAGRYPVRAIVDRYPVSVCFSARLAQDFAEAGVETARAFQGNWYLFAR